MTWVEPEQYWAALPSVHVAAGGLLTDAAGRALLVKPNYGDHWGFPGGSVDEGERPDAAAVREIREEVGLTVTLGTLLVVDWTPPSGARTKPLLHFLFDAGSVDGVDGLVLQADEIDEAALVDADEAAGLMSARGHRRLQAGLRARTEGHTAVGWDGA